MKFAICNELFEGWDFGDVCRLVKSAGYDGLEIAPFTLAAAPATLARARLIEMRQQARDAGIEIVGLHWLLAGTEGLHLTSPDIGARRRLADYLVTLAEICRVLGGDILVFGSPKQRAVAAGVNGDDAFKWASETFMAALPAVAELGVDICMEPLAPIETNFRAQDIALSPIH
jgi:sugar phosphate isomerase/epimerase